MIHPMSEAEDLRFLFESVHRGHVVSPDDPAVMGPPDPTLPHIPVDYVLYLEPSQEDAMLLLRSGFEPSADIWSYVLDKLQAARHGDFTEWDETPHGWFLRRAVVIVPDPWADDDSAPGLE